ncbi:hypothetical protein BKA66DRAFT_546533 [Pyrenochaeta sp. MPI-SDFR-AT-0127]|nr:hypothetical protein BKA66DRAFT_546533 [Pyrenochaeta sp. MPI-SDFR-AT-0127]
MTRSVLVFALASLLGASQAAGLTSCPTAETQVSTPDGSLYAVCSKTDYQGETTELVTQITSPTACATRCNQKSGCIQAVYDKKYSICHLKGPASGLDWVSSQQYTTIRLLVKPGDEISACPTTEKSVTSNGVTLASCANTDYQGETVTAIPQITSAQACAKACAKIAKCSNAVFSSAGSECFIKNPNRAQLRWTYDPKYTSIRVTSETSQAQALNSCPGDGASSISTSNGVKFSACANGDYQANSIDILGNVDSAKACAEICGPRTDCSYASYDSAYKACHIKPTNPAPGFVFNRGFVSLKRVRTPRRA